METNDKRCGTCKHWTPLSKRVNGIQLGNCTAAIPDAVVMEYVKTMPDYRGTNCDCHEAIGEPPQ